MIQSMTGFGKATAITGNRKIIVEIKSLNSKTIDISTRILQPYRDKELEIRSRITSALRRGKVDFAIYIDNTQTSDTPSINVSAFNSYLKQIESISHELNVALPADPFSVILRLPEVMCSSQLQEEVSDEEWNSVSEAIDRSIEELVEYRKAEGAALEKTFREKITNISELLELIGPYEEERLSKIKERIMSSLEENIGCQYDGNRFEQELIYYIEKLDINEEKQRLANHLNYFITTLEEDCGQGKKLGFIAQEMGREINTLGSKSNHAEMQNIVVRMKDELEQIKEQILNVM